MVLSTSWSSLTPGLVHILVVSDTPRSCPHPWSARAVPLEGPCGYAPGHACPLDRPTLGTGSFLGRAHPWYRPTLGTGPLLGQAHSWDRPFKMPGTGPLSGQTLQDSWDNPALIYSTNFATQAGFGSHSLFVLSKQQAFIFNQRRKRDEIP